MNPTDLGLPSKFTHFRPGQFEAALSAATSDYRFVMEANPTGGGKSIIYMTVAQLTDARAIVVTANKGLQNQLKVDFGAIGLVDVRGANNYPCVAVQRGGELDGLMPSYTSCADAPCRSGVFCSMKPTREGAFNRGCTYYDAVRSARKSRLVVTNYDFLMTANRYMEEGALGSRDLLVLDEGHDAADKLSDFMSVTLQADEVDELLSAPLPPIEDGQEAWSAWAELHLRQVELALERTKAQPGIARPDQKSVKLRRRLEDLRRKLAVLAVAGAYRRAEGTDPEVGMPGVSTDWVAERNDDRTACFFTPLWAHRYAEQYLFNHIPKVLIVSATLLPRTAHYLGIEEGAYDYREHKSGFAVARRPVYYLPTAKIDRNSSESDLRAWMVKIDQIISKRPGRNGIIHTVSYDRAWYITQHSIHRSRMVFHKRTDTREKVDYFRKHGGVLVSPSVDTGWDFPYRECEFQIIAKTPFADTRSAVMKARAKADKQYLNYLTALKIVQMSGRGMRAADDRCETFIVDDNIRWFMAAARKSQLVPGWFTAAYKVRDSIPEAPEPLPFRAAQGRVDGA